jgi:hypothetical protein
VSFGPLNGAASHEGRLTLASDSQTQTRATGARKLHFVMARSTIHLHMHLHSPRRIRDAGAERLGQPWREVEPWREVKVRLGDAMHNLKTTPEIPNVDFSRNGAKEGNA